MTDTRESLYLEFREAIELLDLREKQFLQIDSSQPMAIDAAIYEINAAELQLDLAILNLKALETKQERMLVG